MTGSKKKNVSIFLRVFFAFTMCPTSILRTTHSFQQLRNFRKMRNFRGFSEYLKNFLLAEVKFIRVFLKQLRLPHREKFPLNYERSSCHHRCRAFAEKHSDVHVTQFFKHSLAFFSQII